jgi:hypothetical protein
MYTKVFDDILYAQLAVYTNVYLWHTITSDSDILS